MLVKITLLNLRHGTSTTNGLKRNRKRKHIVFLFFQVLLYQHPEVGKVNLKSNGDEALNDEVLLKSNSDEAFNDGFP